MRKDNQKFDNVQDYIDNNGSPLFTRDELKDVILRSALDLLGDCAHNFDGDAKITERVSQPLFFLNDILDNVE